MEVWRIIVRKQPRIYLLFIIYKKNVNMYYPIHNHQLRTCRYRSGTVPGMYSYVQVPLGHLGTRYHGMMDDEASKYYLLLRPTKVQQIISNFTTSNLCTSTKTIDIRTLFCPEDKQVVTATTTPAQWLRLLRLETRRRTVTMVEE